MNNLKIWQVVLMVLAIWLTIALGTFTVYRLIPGVKGPGVFGDSFGVVNSLFSGLAFALLFYSTWLQRKELESQRTELELQREELMLTRKEFAQQNETMRIQRFESTFFNMLSFFEDSKRIGVNKLERHLSKIDASSFSIEQVRNGFYSEMSYIDRIIDCTRLIGELEEKEQVFYLHILSSFLNADSKQVVERLVTFQYARAIEIGPFQLDGLSGK